MTRLLLSALLLLCCPLLAFAEENAAGIDNGIISVTWNDAQDIVSVNKNGKAFAQIAFPDGEFVSSKNGLLASTMQINDRHSTAFTFLLFKDSPFVEINAMLDYHLFEDGILKKLEFPAITLPNTTEEHLSFGTAGLRPFDQQKGSYMFLAAANSKDRSGIVSGWITSRDGSGIVFSEKNTAGQAVFKPVIEYGKLLPPKPPTPQTASSSQTAESSENGKLVKPVLSNVKSSERFVLGYFDDCREGLERYAERIHYANQVRLKDPMAGYCTWYAEKFGGACNETEIVNLTNAAAEKLAPFGFNFVQIDDKWQDGISQNGPKKNFLKVNPKGPYPKGMQPTADYIRSKNMKAGIWLLPFAGSPEDPHWNHDLFAKSGVTDELDENGKPKRSFKIFPNKQGEPYRSRWSGATLDMTNPAAQEYLFKEIEQMAKDWHFNYFKLDGFNAGFGVENIYYTANGEYRQDDLGDAVFHNPEITPVAAHRLGLETIRKAAGDDAFLLGCNISQNMRAFGASFGLVDAMRIGPDNGSGWNSLKRGPWHGTNRYFLNGRVWWNDPDPVYVRDSMPLEHARLIATWVSVSGQLYAFSDWLPALSEERIEIIRRTLRPHGLTSARPVDLFNEEFPKIWYLTNQASKQSTGDRHIVAFYNWNDKEPMKIETTPEWIGLPKAEEYVAFDYWGNKFFGSFQDKLSVEVPAGSCLVLSVQPVQSHPVLLSTSQHVTQGIVDLAEVVWDPASKTLSGISKVIANDPYELRIYDPVKKEIRREMFKPEMSSDSFRWSVKF